MMEPVWIVFILSQLADVVTTQFAITSGRAHESNPIVAWLMNKAGLGWIVIKLVVACFAAYLLQKNGWQDAIWLVSLAFFALAVNNIRVTK
jgi:hypothetical protein